ncbi:MAG TPA: hypothetical protein DCX54_08560 [Flavobacteriales bacterium]|nr:hypothetical protein [Flavobacteriales bacterium]
MEGINIFDELQFPKKLRMSEKSFLSNLVKDSAIYGITKYVSVIAAIFLTPIYTRIIPRFDYGIMDVFNVWIAFCALLIPLGMIEAMPRLWVDIHENTDTKKRIIGSYNLLLLIGIVVFLGVSLLGKTTFEKVILGSENYETVYYLCVSLIVFQILNNQQLTYFRLGFRRLAYTAVSLGNFFILTVLGFSLVYFKKMSIEGFFWASFFAFLFSLIVSIPLNRSFILLSFHKKTIVEIVRYSLPLLYVILFFSVSEVLDRYIIKRFLSTEHIGLYSVAARIASIPLFFTSSFATAWFPRIFSIKEDNRRKEVLIETNKLALHVFSYILFTVVLFRKELIFFFAPDYFDALNVVLILSLANVINGLGPIYAVGIHLKKTSGDFVKAAFISIPVNIVLSVLLVREFGIEGVAFGSLFGAFLWTFLRYRMGQKRLEIEFNFHPVIYLVIFLIFATLLSQYLDLSLWVFLSKLAIGILLMAWLWHSLKHNKNELV